MNAARAKRLVKRAFASPLGWRILGPIARPPGVIVLMYHRILGADRSLVGLPVERFEEQMRWIRALCDPIGPDQLVERASRRRSGRPSVLVTFDDGYRDYHDNAYPILKRLGIPAVVFLATQFMDEGGAIWTDELQWAVQSTKRARVKLPWSNDPAIDLPDAKARAALGETARAYLKKLPDRERREAVKALLAELGDATPRERQMLTWDEVRRTQDVTTYGGHTHTHPILSRLPRAGAETEIRTCRDRIASETGREPKYFAYPNGKPADFTAETKDILRALGFAVAFSTSEGIAGADSDWMAVKRLPGEADDVPGFAWQAAGLARS